MEAPPDPQEWARKAEATLVAVVPTPETSGSETEEEGETGSTERSPKPWPLKRLCSRGLPERIPDPPGLGGETRDEPPRRVRFSDVREGRLVLPAEGEEQATVTIRARFRGDESESSLTTWLDVSRPEAAARVAVHVDVIVEPGIEVYLGPTRNFQAQRARALEAIRRRRRRHQRR